MIEIIHLDADVIVCRKPAGLLSEGEGEDSLLTLLARQCGGQVYPVHRLDRGASGLMVFARHSKAAAALSRAVQEKQLKKEYLALISGIPAEPEGEMTDYLFKDSRKGKVFDLSGAVEQGRGGAFHAGAYRTGHRTHPSDSGAVFFPRYAPVGRWQIRQPDQGRTGPVFLRAGLSPSQNRKAYDLHRPTRRHALESDFFRFERRKQQLIVV